MPSKKYATPEEAKEAKRLKTLESNRRKREEKKALAPKEVKEKAKPRAKKAKAEPESESDIDDEEFEKMLYGTPVATPKALPVRSGFHDLIAFLEQDHGEVVPAASQRPQPRKEVQEVASILAKAQSENIQKGEAQQESVLPAYPIEEKKQVETERVQRDIVGERRKAFHEKVIANRIAKQAELRGEKVNKGNIVWAGSPKYSVDDNWVKPAVSPSYNPSSTSSKLYTSTGYADWIKSIQKPEYETGNLQPRVQKKSRFTDVSPTEHFNNIVEHYKARRTGDLRDQYGRPEYGNLKPPVLAVKPKFSLLHPTQIEHLSDEESARNIQRLLREENKPVYNASNDALFKLITRPRTPREVTPKTKAPTPKKATPKAKVSSEPTLKTVLTNIKQKGTRSDIDQMKTRLKRVETSLKNGKNIEKKQAEIETLKLMIGENAEAHLKHKERLEKLGVVAPSEVVKRRNKQLADLGEKVRAEEIKAKHDARVAKKVAAEEAKANKKLAKQGIVVLGEMPKYKSYQQIVDEEKLEKIQAQGPVILTPEEEDFVNYFRQTYGSVPMLYKEPEKRANAKPDYRQRGETFATYRGKKVYKYS